MLHVPLVSWGTERSFLGRTCLRNVMANNCTWTLQERRRCKYYLLNVAFEERLCLTRSSTIKLDWRVDTKQYFLYCYTCYNYLFSYTSYICINFCCYACYNYLFWYTSYIFIYLYYYLCLLFVVIKKHDDILSFIGDRKRFIP